MKVTVMSRWDAVFYCYNPHAEPAVMISISDPHMQYAAAPFSSEENKVLQILALCFADAADYDRLRQGDTLRLRGIHAGLESGRLTLESGGAEIPLVCAFSARQRAILKAGGLLNYTREAEQ